MRLLHTVTGELQEFDDQNRPPYAILSHTWAAREEVTFENMQSPGREYIGKPGWPKVWGCCAQARKDGYSWVWIDMCCINRNNYLELSEGMYSLAISHRLFTLLQTLPRPRPQIVSGGCTVQFTHPSALYLAINSMWRWYKDSNQCYAYLSDVDMNGDPEEVWSSFRKSRFWTRGWTLPEMLAPLNIDFFDST